MPERRPRFGPQFRAEVVRLVIETGRPIAEVARGLGVNEQTLGNWVKAWRDADHDSEPELSPVERARVKELEEGNRRLRMENEFAKKADYTITGMCALLGVARSTYYAWRDRTETPTAARRREAGSQALGAADCSLGAGVEAMCECRAALTSDLLTQSLQPGRGHAEQRTQTSADSEVGVVMQLLPARQQPV